MVRKPLNSGIAKEGMTGEPALHGTGSAQWPVGLVILLLLLCLFYGSYRAFHLAITNDELQTLTCAHRPGYAHLILADDWSSQAQFLNSLLAKPCVNFLPLNETVASRLPSLVGLLLFLWGVWRIGTQFPTGLTRVLITLALLSNAYVLDYFGLSRGYGLALGFTGLSLSYLMQASMVKSAGDRSARRQAAAALWLAFGSALSNMGFLYFYVAILAVIFWQSWRNHLRVNWSWWSSPVLLGIFYVPRVLMARSQNALYLGGDVGFIHDTVGSLVRSTFYDLAIPTWLTGLLSAALTVLVCLLACWSHRERLHAAFALSVVTILVAALYITAHEVWDVKYPMERAALFFLPLVIVNIGVVAASSRLKWLSLFLWGVLLTLTGIGLENVNLNHTLTWRTNADIPSVLLALQKVHQQTGQRILLAMSDGTKWSAWYYAEHLLGLHLKPSPDQSYVRTYDWLRLYEWRVSQTYFSFPPEHPLCPNTTHLLLDRGDASLLSTQLAGGLTPLEFYPDSDVRLYKPSVPEHQGALIYPDGRTYAGEFADGDPNGEGTTTLPDGSKFVGHYRDGVPNGQGSVTFPSGRKYVGGFRDGLADGQGTAIWPDGRKYVGEYKDGDPNGEGTMTLPDGTKFVGHYRDGAPNGQGTATWPDGRKYVGGFKDGLPNGQGALIYPDGRTYVGEFADGDPNGEGTTTLPDGSKFVGHYRDGKPDGQGTLTSPSGTNEHVEWKDGKLYRATGNGSVFRWHDGSRYMEL